MIPILFESNSTSFSTNGIGRLSDAVSVVVSEERNGPYELQMEYPVTGIHYGDIQLFRIIFAVPADGASGQPFEIYEISKPLNGIVTIRAWHISYRLNRIVVQPFTAASCSAALTGLKNNSITTNDFTFGTDKSVSATFTVSTPASVRSLLGGQEGSILDVYGKGEYYWNLFSVYLYTNRGSNNGVTIRYGKNLTEMTATSDMETVYTGIVPFYYNEETKELVELSSTKANKVLWSGHQADYPVQMVKSVDLSGNWSDSAPSSAQLATAAQAYLDANEGWGLNENLVVSFVALQDTEEYKDVAALQHVNLCDTVTIIHEGLGVSASAKVIRTEYDTLLERYNEIELGTTQVSLGQAITEEVKKEVPTTSQMEQAIANGTALITGNDGGYIKFKYNANGQPQELLIMNNTTEATSSKIWRWNSSGIGYSSDYGATYKQAWTLDGQFYTDWVTAGTINAALVNAGTLSSYDGKVQIVLGDANNAGKLIIDSTNFDIDSSGNVTITGQINAQTGSIGGFTIDNNSIYSGTKGSGTSNGDITLSSSNFEREIDNGDGTSTSRSYLRFAIGSGFAVRRDGAVFAGNLVANTGKIGGDNGLKILPDKGIYSGSKSSLMSGANGIYIGTDGISIGSQGDTGKKKPLMWLDQMNERLNVMRLDFMEPTNTAPYYTTGHSIYLDDHKRLLTGGGMDIGGAGSSGGSDASAEFNTEIHNYLWATIAGGSDRRIKEDIKEISTESARDFIMAARPVSFTFTKESLQPHGIHHGFIAQEMEECVNDDWNLVPENEKGIKFIHYQEIIADLVKVVQDQQKRIEALEAALKEKE